MSMGEMFNGSGGYSLSGGSSEAGGNDKVGGSISGNTFGVLPPLPPLTSQLSSTFGVGASNNNAMFLLLAGVSVAGVYLYMRGR